VHVCLGGVGGASSGSSTTAAHRRGSSHVDTAEGAAMLQVYVHTRVC
jgi:hypothetical protein